MMEKTVNRQFVSKIENYIRKNHMLDMNDRLVIGVSGGADSVALFVVLNELKDKFGLKLSVVHVHHGLRPEADEEAAYVESLCNEYNVDFNLFRFDVNKESKALGLGTEETGRKLRYDCFEKLAGKSGKIAIAHNLNDRAETMLFHLCRGTGPRGMAAIKPVSGNRIRPLLCVQRKEIEAFLNEAGIKFYVDASNLENEYTRNKIRNIILPTLEAEINSEAVSHISQAAELMETQNAYISEVAKKELNEVILDKASDYISISRSKFCCLDICIKREVIKILIDYLVPTNKDITLNHIDSIIELVAREGNFTLNLPYRISAFLEYDVLKLSFEKEAKESDKTVIKLEEGSYKIPGLGLINVSIDDKRSDFVLLQKEYTKYFDYDKINCCVELRNRKQGDYLTVNSSLGKKKLKDFFIDNKVPVKDRDEAFLLADGSHIMWIIGSRISEYYKISDKTEKILTVEVIKEEI